MSAEFVSDLPSEVAPETSCPPIRSGIFTHSVSGENDEPSLLGGYCCACDSYHFPRSRYCRRCLGAVEEARIGGSGRIYSFTAVRTKPPFGLPQPYGVGFVDLTHSGLRVLGLIDPGSIDDCVIGDPVVLAVKPLGHDGTGQACLRPYFTLMKNDTKPAGSRA
ncbi:MAG: hypothetical protein DCC73_02990 [Proteobacteria bacterium]|nr:MAG: hypothetical protein DCC73_02990 [Pseudomonadota bacterium]